MLNPGFDTQHHLPILSPQKEKSSGETCEEVGREKEAYSRDWIGFVISLCLDVDGVLYDSPICPE